jgi:hypothetical protein
MNSEQQRDYETYAQGRVLALRRIAYRLSPAPGPGAV